MTEPYDPSTIANMWERNGQTDNGHPGVRTHTGRDFLTEVREELEDFIHPDGEGLPDDIKKGLPSGGGITVDTKSVPPSQGNYDTKGLDGPGGTVYKLPGGGRYAVVLMAAPTNSAPVSVSRFQGIRGTANEQGTYSLPPGGSLTIKHTQDVYLLGQAPGLFVSIATERF